MFTKLTPIEDFKSIFAEILFNKTDKITKTSSGSVNNAIAFGNAKLGQKITKDIAALEARIFPDFSYGQYLDDIAMLWGIGDRFGAKQSSTYVRVTATPGTVYQKGVNVFRAIDGSQFFIENTYTVGQFGWGYVKVRSVNSGSTANVDAFTITEVNPKPIGHQYCINEYAASFGIDNEIDDTFRLRIKEGSDILSRATLSAIEQVFMKINENILRVYYNGSNAGGGLILSILTVNGVDLTTEELADLLLRGQKFFSLSDMHPIGNTLQTNLILNNVSWFPIDISFRCKIDASYNTDAVRKEIQIILNKYLDYRYWQTGTKIEWDNLLELVKRVPGVEYVADEYFYPTSDVVITDNKLMPRIRGFQMLDMDGNIIQDLQGELNPVYYPNDIDFSYQATVLKQI